MKYNKIFRILALAMSLSLLLMVAVTPALAQSVPKIELDPSEGKIGDRIEIDGRNFDTAKIVAYLYFSSDEASRGDYIDEKVVVYEYIGTASINTAGELIPTHTSLFEIPDRLVDGKYEEDVHGGDYYVYVTYRSSTKRCIEARARLTVIDGEIKLDPDEGHVGTEVEISGEGLRPNQKIMVKYDGNFFDIASGDDETDSDGKFSCTIIIPEGTAGNHTITVIDESGDKPEAEFRVEPEITINPNSATMGTTVDFRGTGFGREEVITITLYGYKTPTTPIYIRSNQRGSFNGSFGIAFDPAYANGGITQVGASDSSFNTAEAQLTILPVPSVPPPPASISLRPITSLTSPGHVGMELTIEGTRFIANTMVTVTYSNSETITVATATTEANGNFSATFTAPPSIAGSYTVTATDDTNTLSDVFIMESKAPPMPIPLLPEIATAADAQKYFDWMDVTDPSGVTYTFQIGTDDDFATIVLERGSLTDSEYTLTAREKLAPTDRESPYYWRVKAIDGACNESEWTMPMSFYVGFSWTSIPAWLQYIFYGLGVLLLGGIGFWRRRRTT